MPELVLLNFYGAQDRFQGIDSASLCSLAGRYDNPIPSRFLVPIDCLKIPALNVQASAIPHALPEMELLDIKLAKDSSLLLHAIHSRYYWRI
jgi:hypothetical protein